MLYGEDLAFVQATAFGELATRAIPAVIALLRKREAATRRVLDVGCGAGVTTRALIDAGFEVIAVEPSSALLAIAKATAPEATFVNASIYDIELPKADAILALGEPLGYHAPDVDGDARLADFFRAAARALSSEGTLAFDLIVRGSPPLDASGGRSGEGWDIHHRTTEDSAAGRLTRTIETFRRVGTLDRRSHEIHHVRVFDADLVVRWLEAAGFDVETAEAYGDYRLAPRRRAFIGRARPRSRP